FRQGCAGKRDCRICPARAPLRRPGCENRIVTEGEAAPAAPPEQGSRNLLMRVLAAVVLAPLAIAIAWVGGSLWALLVMLATIGLYLEWLVVVGLVRDLRASVPGVA